MRKRTALFLAGATIASLAQIPAVAQTRNAPAPQHKLTIATGGAFTSLDPHYHNLGPNNTLAAYVQQFSLWKIGL
ncbi:MAG: hypothetical protein EXR07_17180 [Acetobacteraceae bacterium]|nr:hypothetical protein [Acetobacteraceae bacterium]